MAVVLVAGLGTAMGGVDTMGVAVALPSIRDDLDSSLLSLEWILTAYLLAGGALMLVAGRISDLLGARRIFLAGVLAFMAASLVASVAPSSGLLIAGRALQGLGAAFMIPTALTLISNGFSDPVRRTRALGLWVAMFGVSVAAGPMLGGPITELLGWRWVFLVNVPIALLTVVLTLLVVPRSRTAHEGVRLDLPGAAAITGALSCLLLAITQGNSWGWGSAKVAGLFAGAVGLTLVFVLLERHARSPVIDLKLLRSRAFVATNVAAFVLYFGIFAWLFYFSFYLQRGLGNTATVAALLLLPATLGLVVGTVPGAQIQNRRSVGAAVGAGAIVSAAGFVMLALTPTGVDFSGLWLPFIVLGIGCGMAMGPLNEAGIAAVAKRHTGSGAGISYTFRWIGGALGVAISGVVFRAVAEESLTEHGVVDTSSALESLLRGTADPSTGAPSSPLTEITGLSGMLHEGIVGVMLVAAAMCVIQLIASRGLAGGTAPEDAHPPPAAEQAGVLGSIPAVEPVRSMTSDAQRAPRI